MDQNTKIIIGVVIAGAVLWYLNKAPEEEVARK